MDNDIQGKYENILEFETKSLIECKEKLLLEYQKNKDNLGFLLCCSFGLKNFSDFSNFKPKQKIYIKLLCNWCTSEELRKCWLKMGNNQHGWNNIHVVSPSGGKEEKGEKIDYYVVINSTKEFFIPNKTILFRMEPKMYLNKNWGIWSKPEMELLKIFNHEGREYNNIEWHISKTYKQLIEESIHKNEDYNSIISTVVSEKYIDPGQIRRIDFIKFLESKKQIIHVFGDNKWNYKNYKGKLPYHNKDNGLLPYKYTFNAENHNEDYYVTEKLIDGILSECLVFYWGCDNISSIIDPNSYVKLTLSNFENDLSVIQNAMKQNLYEERLPFIRKEKNRILNHLQFFPRLERFIKSCK
jgi:hypothetical protein